MIYMSFFIGLILICKGGDWFVDAASKLSEILGIPKYVIGATIVSFATTMPEIIVSVAAALDGHSAMAIGNAVGSVSANTGIILALFYSENFICILCSCIIAIAYALITNKNMLLIVLKYIKGYGKKV